MCACAGHDTHAEQNVVPARKDYQVDQQNSLLVQTNYHHGKAECCACAERYDRADQHNHVVVQKQVFTSFLFHAKYSKHIVTYIFALLGLFTFALEFKIRF